jgi:hypothetical protein
MVVLGALVLVVLTSCGRGGGGGSNSSSAPARLQPTWVINGSGAPGTTGAGPATTGGSGAASRPGSSSSNDLAGISEAYAKVKSYKATYVMEASGTKQDGNMEVVLPDKFHMTFASPAGNIEVILIGSDTYFKAGPSWIKQTSTAGAPQAFDPKSISGTVQGWRSAGAVKGATAVVSGKTCQIYTITSQAGNQELCIADNLPYRMISQSGGTKTTITFSDYNANIDIKAPI